MSAAQAVSGLLRQRGSTIAVAETSSGGGIAQTLLAMRGASGYFRGGVVCYSKDSKATLLGIQPGTSKPTSTEAHASELAAAVRERLAADWGIGETGVAGPTPNSHGVAPGVCAVAVVGPNNFERVALLQPGGDEVSREQNMARFTNRALELLHESLEPHASGTPLPT